MRRLSSALLTLAVAAVVLVNPVGRAEAQSSAPYARLSCGQGQVFTSAPSVTANQGTAQNPHVWWIAHLLRYDGTRWVHAQWSPWFLDTVEADTGFSLGTTWGYAGGAWFLYNEVNAVGFQGYNSFRFDVPSGGWYAIVNWVAEGEWSNAVATTGTGGYWCGS